MALVWKAMADSIFATKPIERELSSDGKSTYAINQLSVNFKPKNII
jgi:hypothetical protein